MDPLSQILWGQGARETITLRYLVSLASKNLKLRIGFNTFGDNVQLQAFADPCNRLGERAGTFTFFDIVDKTLVQLDGIDGQSQQVTQAGVTGAKIVNG
jgi:hypothetical protein